VVSVLFALLTALFNGLASVLQRTAAAAAPQSAALHLSLFSYLIRRKVWLAGIGMVILAAVCQATALATGPVALVQPIFIIELPFTLLVASRVNKRRLPRTTWWAVGLVTVSLGAGLAAAAPSGGSDQASTKVWVTALIVTGVFEAVVITVGVRTRGNARGAALGLAAACGYALTATLMKSAVSVLPRGAAAFFGTWQLYATAVAGVGALFLLQNALQAGSLVAVQPPLTLGDALISSAFGVTIYNEVVQTGGWLLVVEIVAVIAVTLGCIQLSRSLSMVHGPPPAAPPAPESARLTQLAGPLTQLTGQRRMITGSPGTFTSVWKKAAMSMGIRMQPCETGASGTSVSPWMANAVPMKNTELYIKPSGTAIQPGKNDRVR
jgi:drug/metabolite transporter (DMT)-like permease